MKYRQQETKPTAKHHPKNTLVQCPAHWCRPVPPRIEREVAFQVTSTTYDTVQTPRGVQADICLFGVTAEGNSVCGILSGFDAYFYVTTHLDINQVVEYLNSTIDKAVTRSNYYAWIRSSSPVERYVTSCDVLQGQSIMGWKPPEETETFFRINLLHPGYVPIARKALEKPPEWIPWISEGDVVTYEANVAFELRFMADMDFGGHQWVRLKNVAPVASNDKISRCQIEIQCQYTDLEVIPLAEMSDLAPTIIVSYDIECRGTRGAFPRADKNEVITIGAHIRQTGNPDWAIKVSFCLRETAPSDDLEVYSFDDEGDMLCSFMEFIRCVDPDVIVGYNNDLFDNKYIYERAQALGLAPKKDPNSNYLVSHGKRAFWDATRIKGRQWKVERKEEKTKAHGTTVTYTLNMYGRYSFDLWRYVLKNYKLRGYGLNEVATYFLGEQKVDLPYSLIEPLFEEGPDGREKIAHYCSQDCTLPWRIINHQMVEFNLAEMARVTGVPLFWLLSRGQQIKVQSLLLRQGRKMNVFLPTVTDIDDGSYKGATVVDPHRDYYTTEIVTLDFASLYPSIMQEKNLSHDTETTVARMKQLEYKEGPDYEVHPEKPHKCFVTATVKKGILPIILATLLAQRKIAKDDMANAKNPTERAIFNGRQLALKITANSVYGFTGVKHGTLPCKSISTMVTVSGRGMIEHLSREIEAKFSKDNGYPTDVNVVYGDSVTGDTPILVRDPLGNVRIVEIDQLANSEHWEPYPQFKEGRDKQQHPGDNWLVWSAVGNFKTGDGCNPNGAGCWTPIRRIIRHKTEKRIYRVLTHTGCVDVTEDHSLLSEDGIPLKPKDCTVGQTLLHRPQNVVESSTLNFEDIADFVHRTDLTLSEKRAFCYGLFFAEGSCGSYNGPKYSWAINNANYEWLEIVAQFLREVEVGQQFKILNTIGSSGCYKLVPVGKIKPLVLAYRPMFYNSRKEKVIPLDIQNGSNDVKLAFFAGAYLGDGSKCTNEPTKCLRYDLKGKVGAAQLFQLLSSIGYSCSINDRKDKLSVFRLTVTQTKQRKSPNAIKKIYELGPIDDFVYDIETEEGAFQAGIGNMILKNTDSVFVDTRLHDPLEAWLLAENMAQYGSALFRAPHDLELEKGYCPFLLVSKKRYAGDKYELASKVYHPFTREELKFKVSSSGMENVRRDNCPVVPRIINEVLHFLLKKRDPEAAEAAVKAMIADLYQNKLSMADLIISKKFSKTFEEYAQKNAKQPHVELAKKMRTRDPATAPRPGDRVKYIVAEGQWHGKDFTVADNAEDPLYALEHGIKPDARYYVERQIAHPLCKIFAPIFEPHTDMHDRIKRKKAHRTLTYQRLFIGEHSTKRVKLTPKAKTGGIMRFVTVSKPCLSCGAKLPPKQTGVCAHCSNKRKHITVEYEDNMATLKQKEADIWTICEGCEPDPVIRNACTNKACATLYDRRKVALDIEDIAGRIQQLKK